MGPLAAQQVGVLRARRVRGRAADPHERHPGHDARSGALRRVRRRGGPGRRRRYGVPVRGPPVGLHELERARGVLRGRDEGSGRADLLHRAGPPEHADPGPEESRPAAVDHRRGAGRAAVLPVPPRSRPGRRGAGLAVANGVQRGARVRGLPAARACSRALGGGARRGRDTVRRGRDRADPRRGRDDRDGLRLRAAPAHAVRPGPGSLRRAARAEHGHGGARDDRGRSTEPVPDRAPRGRTAAGLRRDRRSERAGRSAS